MFFFDILFSSHSFHFLLSFLFFVFPFDVCLSMLGALLTCLVIIGCLFKSRGLKHLSGVSLTDVGLVGGGSSLAILLR